MDETEYLKCPCKVCGTHLEFPVRAAGTTITCPNCGQWTELLSPEAPTESTGFTINLSWVVVAFCLVVAAAGAFWWHHRQATTAEGPTTPVVKLTPKPAAPPTTLPTNPPAIIPAQAVVTAPAKPRPKASADLKTGDIHLEKTPNTTLVYAVGTMTNDSDWQRFGVRIELDLMNAQGKKIGTTQDYKEVLEPRQTWDFRALIPEKKATAAKLETITEQE